MFIDYVALLLLNMSAGFFVLAAYLLGGIRGEDRAKWAPAFGAVGIVAFLCGLHMAWTWPLPSVYNIPYGEMSVLLGSIFLAVAWSLSRGWSPAVVGIYSAVAGVAAALLGVRMLVLHQTNWPIVTCVGFCLSGLGAVLAGPAIATKAGRGLRGLAAVVLILAAVLWALMAYYAYWMHMSGFEKWQPQTQIERVAPAQKP
jgi:putative membrane protein